MLLFIERVWGGGGVLGEMACVPQCWTRRRYLYVGHGLDACVSTNCHWEEGARGPSTCTCVCT
jgi:hypothetical protein